MSEFKTTTMEAVMDADDKQRLLDADLSCQMEQVMNEKDEAYHERNRMVAALSMLWPTHMKRHPDSDTEWEDEWRNIVCIHSPAGQMTWHIHDSETPLFQHLNVKPDPFADCEWDGHTTPEKYRRLPQSMKLFNAIQRQVAASAGFL